MLPHKNIVSILQIAISKPIIWRHVLDHDWRERSGSKTAPQGSSLNSRRWKSRESNDVSCHCTCDVVTAYHRSITARTSCASLKPTAHYLLGKKAENSREAKTSAMVTTNELHDEIRHWCGVQLTSVAVVRGKFFRDVFCGQVEVVNMCIASMHVNFEILLVGSMITFCHKKRDWIHLRRNVSKWCSSQ